MESRRLPTGLMAAYAAPAVALAMPTLPIFVFLPAFYAETLGIGLTATGLALLAARGFDVLSDPLVGHLSDRYVTPWGRRRPWVVGGGVLAAGALLALVTPPEGAGAGYLAGFAALLYLGWTLIAVPYGAWGAELSPDYRERTRITAWREGAMVVGILLAGTLPVVLGDTVEPMVAVSWAAVALGLPAFWVLVTRVPEGRMTTGRSLDWAAAGELLGNGPFVRLLAAWFVNGLANGLPAVTFLLYLDHGLKVEAAIRDGLILVYFLAAVLALPAWTVLARHWGKHRTWAAAMVMAVCAFATVPWISVGDWEVFALVCLLTGAALGADMALPPAMQADVVDFDTLKTGERRAGLLFAFWSMATKLSLALAAGLGLPALAALGFTPAVDDGPDPLWPLLVIYAALPVVLKGGAIVLIWNHPITARRHAAILRRLARRQPVETAS